MNVCPQISLVPLKEAPLITTADLKELAFSIWKDPTRAQSALDSFIRTLTIGECDHSQYYLIKRANQLVGIIGHFEFSHTDQIIGLTWSGVIATHQKKGIYKEALNLLSTVIKTQYPYALYLEELVPLGTSHDAVIPPFLKLGFKLYGQHVDTNPLFNGATILRRTLC